MKANRCPECQAKLSRLSSCGCGWKEGGKLKVVDYRCHYGFDNQRCPLVGTLVEGLKNDKWLCRAHFATRHDAALAEAVLRDIQQNLFEWNTHQKDWRAALLEQNLKAYSFAYFNQKKSIEEHLQVLKDSILKKSD